MKDYKSIKKLCIYIYKHANTCNQINPFTSVLLDLNQLFNITYYILNPTAQPKSNENLLKFQMCSCFPTLLFPNLLFRGGVQGTIMAQKKTDEESCQIQQI